MSKKRRRKGPTPRSQATIARHRNRDRTRRGAWSFPEGCPAGRVDQNEGTVEVECDGCGLHLALAGFEVHGPCPQCGCETGTLTGRYLGVLA